MTIDDALVYADNIRISKYASREPAMVLAAEVRRLRDENAELERLFALQHTRVGELQELWRKATGKQGFIPDLGNLSEWATGEIIRLRERERVLVNLLDQWDESAVLTGATGSLVEFTRSALEAVKE